MKTVHEDEQGAGSSELDLAFSIFFRSSESHCIGSGLNKSEATRKSSLDKTFLSTAKIPVTLKPLTAMSPHTFSKLSRTVP